MHNRRFGNNALIANLLVAVAVITLVGCEQTASSASKTPMTIAPVQHEMLGGIPLPKGFVTNDDRTIAVESGRVRIARYEFIGEVPKNKVHRFFLDHMPSAGFALKQRSDEAGIVSLLFQSGTEVCDIRIGSKSFKTFIIVNLRPLPQGTPHQNNDVSSPRTR